jgi:hypothetical protein
MADDTPAKIPMYAPFKTFSSTIEGFSASGGVPAKLDRTVLSTMSGSGRSTFLGGMRFLGLVDDDNHALPMLDKYVEADAQERKGLLREILTNSYGFLTNKNFDLTRATGGTLSDAMTKEGATPSTREKAVAFFLKAAEEAGIEVSPHILKRKHSPSTSSKPRPAKTKKTVAKGKSDGLGAADFVADDARFNALIAAASAKLSELDVLMKRIFNPADMSKEEEQAVFVLARYLQLKELKKQAEENGGS